MVNAGSGLGGGGSCRSANGIGGYGGTVTTTYNIPTPTDKFKNAIITFSKGNCQGIVNLVAYADSLIFDIKRLSNGYSVNASEHTRNAYDYDTCQRAAELVFASLSHRR